MWYLWKEIFSDLAVNHRYLQPVIGHVSQSKLFKNHPPKLFKNLPFQNLRELSTV